MTVEQTAGQRKRSAKVGLLSELAGRWKALKEGAYQKLTEARNLLQQKESLKGLSRTYVPRAEDGIKYPDEVTNVKYCVFDIDAMWRELSVEFLDAEFAKSLTNTKAFASLPEVGIHDAVIPALALLELRRFLIAVKTVTESIPTLPPTTQWTRDENTGNLYMSGETVTHKTKKINKPIVLHEGTDKHPPQVQLVHEDVVEGFWHSHEFSGAIPAADKEVRLRNVMIALDAVDAALARANQQKVEHLPLGEKIVNFLFLK